VKLAFVDLALVSSFGFLSSIPNQIFIINDNDKSLNRESHLTFRVTLNVSRDYRLFQ
jgi:hypothetical protein